MLWLLLLSCILLNLYVGFTSSIIKYIIVIKVKFIVYICNYYFDFFICSRFTYQLSMNSNRINYITFFFYKTLKIKNYLFVITCAIIIIISNTMYCVNYSMFFVSYYNRCQRVCNVFHKKNCQINISPNPRIKYT